MTYSWEILELYTKDVTNSDGAVLSNAVSQIIWRRTLTAEGGEDRAHYLSATDVDASETSESDFVSYDSLSPEIIVSWIESRFTAADTAMINKLLERDLTARPEKTNLPWL